MFKYECILGFVCLGYLDVDDIKKSLKGMKQALTNTGYIIMIEAIDNR